jgi:F1F0 ATPase subunit 2
MSATALLLAASALAGAAVGAAYMALLWLAVRGLPRTRGGVARFLALTLARAGLILGALGLALALEVPASGLLAALAGFVAVRLAATRLSRAPTTGGDAWK